MATLDERVAILETKSEISDAIHMASRMEKVESEIAAIREQVSNHLPTQIRVMTQLVVGLYIALISALLTNHFWH